MLQVAAADGDAALYDRYVAKLAATRAQPEEYNRFLDALTAFQDPALVKRTLEYALSDAVRSQDAPTLIAGALVSSQKNLAWEFVREKWPALIEKLGVFQGLPAVFQPLGGVLRPRQGRGDPGLLRQEPAPGGGAPAAAVARAHRELRRDRRAAIGAVCRLAEGGSLTTPARPQTATRVPYGPPSRRNRTVRDSSSSDGTERRIFRDR